MKTHKSLFSQIVDFGNLLEAALKAARGKRERSNVMEFFSILEDNLWGLHSELSNRTYRPGAYATFSIYRPKPRLISAAPFRDRVVHHAVINVVGPLIERGFIHDTYANRPGKGTHKAIRRFQSYLRQYEYVLQCDIRKYFPSIDHEILKSMFRRIVADDRTLGLMDLIVDNSNRQEFTCDYFPGDILLTPIERRRGLPIGNLTSQFFANFYLSPFDHFVKETLRCKAYLRYVDDFVLFSDSKRQLQQWHGQIARFLASYRLKLHPRRVQLFPARVGGRFLGQVIYRSRRRLTGENVRRFRQRLRKWEQTPPENLPQRIASWVGHAQQADTNGLLRSLGPLTRGDCPVEDVCQFGIPRI